MVLTKKIISTEWIIYDESSYINYKKRFYTARDGKELFFLAVLFQKLDTKWLVHSHTEISSVRPFKLKPFEVKSFLDVVEKFVIENYYKLYETPALIEKASSEPWKVRAGDTYDTYTKYFYSRKYNSEILRIDVLLGKFEVNSVEHFYTHIYSTRIFRLKPSTAQKLLDVTENFVKEVIYKYYEPML